MKDLSNYAIATIGSHNVLDFCLTLLRSIKDNGIKYKKLYFGDAGFLDSDKEALREVGLENLSFIDFPVKFTDAGIETQSETYRKIIANRIWFLQKIYKEGNESILQLDADTAILSNDFSKLDPDADITLTVREAGPGLHCLPIQEDDYPNCGVIFWTKMSNCQKFLDRWLWAQESGDVPEHQGVFEQWYFYYSTQTQEFKDLNAQKLHCRYYNCYDPTWINDKTSILHFKSCDVKRDTFDIRVKRLLMRLDR